MSLELINTFGTLVTVAIVGATAIAALAQLRHMRAGNQINAVLSIQHQFDERTFREAFDLMVTLSTALENPAFRDYEFSIDHVGERSAVDPTHVELRHAARLVGNFFDQLGILVKNGSIDRYLFLDAYSASAAGTWRRMAPYIAWLRQALRNDALWENFEYLTVLSEDWRREYPSTYPKSVRRLQPHNPWPVPQLPSST